MTINQPQQATAPQHDAHVAAREASRNPFVCMRYSPHLSGRARQFGANYVGLRVIETTDGQRPASVKSSTVVRVVREVGGIAMGSTERSAGFRAARECEALAKHLNRLHHHRMGWRPLTIAEIDRETNIEHQREMIEAIGGMDRYARRAKFVAIASDETGTLVERRTAAAQPIRAVAVTCPSTGRRYLLRVPPQTATAKAGVAWTFGLTEAAYNPTQQS